MKAEGFIASRLRFKGKLATVAIAVSFLVMILSLAIAGGFRQQIRKGISAVAGDIMLTGTNNQPVDLNLSYLDRLRTIKGVRSLEPVLWKPAIIKGADDICGVLVKGVPMPDSLSLQARVPSRLAKRLHISEGDSFVAYFVDEKVRARRFTASVIYVAPVDSDEMLTLIVPLADLQHVSGMDENAAGALEVLLDDGARADDIAMQMNLTAYGQAGADEDILRASTAQRRYPQLFDWLNLIDFNVLAIILLMTAVAGFNMISGLLILLFRNISTIGTLKSMGMGNRAIGGVFLRLSARIVAAGMLAGNALALLFCLIQGTTHLIKLNPENYFVSFVPVSVNIPLVLIVDALAFGVIMLLLLIPTLFISKVDPAVTVRVK